MENLVKTLCGLIEAGANKRAVFAFCKAISKLREYRNISRLLSSELLNRRLMIKAGVEDKSQTTINKEPVNNKRGKAKKTVEINN